MSFEKLELERQNKILNAACEMFAKHGYKKASMKDIADVGGISKSVLFKYFSTKENLYIKIVRFASDSIREADENAATDASLDSDMFSLMRGSVTSRLSLFKEYPWVYRFSYSIMFDTDPFVRALVKKELEYYGEIKEKSILRVFNEFRGLREDISPETARKLILWVSQGYLEEQLNKNETELDCLKQGFDKWIDTLEKLLKK